MTTIIVQPSGTQIHIEPGDTLLAGLQVVAALAGRVEALLGRGGLAGARVDDGHGFSLVTGQVVPPAGGSR